jgi:hypothetical protein
MTVQMMQKMNIEDVNYAVGNKIDCTNKYRIFEGRKKRKEKHKLLRRSISGTKMGECQ